MWRRWQADSPSSFADAYAAGRLPMVADHDVAAIVMVMSPRRLMLMRRR